MQLYFQVHCLPSKKNATLFSSLLFTQKKRRNETLFSRFLLKIEHHKQHKEYPLRVREKRKKAYLCSNFKIEVVVIKSSMEIFKGKSNTFRGGSTTAFVGFFKEFLELKAFSGLCVWDGYSWDNRQQSGLVGMLCWGRLWETRGWERWASQAYELLSQRRHG